MNFNQQNDIQNTYISQKFVSFCNLILQSQSFKKYFKLIFLLSFCIIEIIDMTLKIFVYNADFSQVQNEYTLFLILVFISLIIIPLVSYNLINLIFKEVIFCCLLGCLFESFILNQKNILRFCAFFIFSQRTMNDMKKQKGSSITIFIIVLYPLIRYSIQQLQNLPQLFQYFLLLIANVLFSFIKQPYINSKETKELIVMIQKNTIKNNKTLKHNINLSSVTQNAGETCGLQAEGQYLNKTRHDQNSLIEFNNHINQYNISMNDEEAYPNSSNDMSQIKNGSGIKHTNQFLSEREVQLNQNNIKIFQSIPSIHENNFQSNQQSFNGIKFSLNMISTGIIILDEFKKLVYTNNQSKKIIRQNKKQGIIDELKSILSLNLQINKNGTQTSKFENQQKKRTNQKKQIHNLVVSAKLEKVFEDQKQDRENERNKTTKGKQKQDQYGSVIYNQYQSSKHNYMKKGQNQQTEDQRKQYKKTTTVEVMSYDYEQEVENKNKKHLQLESQKYSIQIGESFFTQNNQQQFNMTNSIQNIKSPQMLSLQHSQSNISKGRMFVNKQEKQFSLPQIFNFQEQYSPKILQCLLPNNINKLFTKNNLSVDDIISFLIKFSISPQYQKLNTDNQIQSEEESEDSISDLSSQFEIQREMNQKKTKTTEVANQEDEEESEYLDIQMKQQIENDKSLIYKNNKIENNCINFKQAKESIIEIETGKHSKKERQTTNNSNKKKIYDYFIQNNFLHLTVDLVDNSLKKQDNITIQIKLSVLIEIDQNYEKKFVQIEISDITKLKKHIDKENLEVYKNKILSSISHELRTPLNCSIQMLEMLTQNEDIPDIIKQIFIFPAFNSNCLLLNIINDILDLAQINYGKFTMQFSQLELNKICAECINLISMQAIQKNLEIELDLDPSIPQEIHSDSNRIRQVLLNLLSNALKFTQEGKITIRTTLKEEKLIQIDIEDTGCGISEKNLKDIIERFGKKDIYNFENHQNKSQLNTMGVGLGLTIANNLAAGLGGNRKLQVQSVENVGSKFQFWIVDHPLNKIGCDFIQKSIFSQEVVKWQSISETSSKKQQQQLLSQQIYVQNDSKCNINNQSNSYNQGCSQSMANASIKSKKKYEESTNSLMPMKYIQPMQSLIRFNTEINQNILSSHITNYQKQETNSIISQSQSQYEVGKTKKFQLSYKEQTLYSEEPNSIIEQNLYPQFYGTIKTKTLEQNNSKLLVLENYLNSDSQISLRLKNEIGPLEKVNEQDQHQQNINQPKLNSQNSPTHQNPIKKKDSALSSLQTIIDHKNKSSLINFSTVKSSILIPNKPNTEFQTNIILSTLNTQTLHLSSHDNNNKILKHSNIKSLLQPVPHDIQINLETSNLQCINVFKPLVNSKELHDKQIKLKEIKEGQCDIVFSNEVQNIQLPNLFDFQKVSEKRQKEFNDIPKLPEQQINSNFDPKKMNDVEIKIKFQDINMDDLYQNDALQDKLQQDAHICSDSLLPDNESAVEWGSTYNKTSEEQKQISIFNKENIDLEQTTTTEEMKRVEENYSQKTMNELSINKKAIKSPKTPNSSYQLSIYSNDQNKKIQQNNESLNSKSLLVIDKKQEQNNNNIPQKCTQQIDCNQTVKQQMLKYNSNRKCQCSNILIIDDNEFNIYALELRLKQYGFIIDRAISGIVGIELVKKKFEGLVKQQCCKLYYLIFMDIDMPVKNGYETTKDILSYFKEKRVTQPPPISACTAFVQQTEQNKAVESGMLFYITKPINQQKLEDVLSSVIKITNFNK